MGSAATVGATIASSNAAASCATRTDRGGLFAARCLGDAIAAVVLAHMVHMMRETGERGNVDSVAETGEHMR
jgi:hypothetical protein